MSGEYIAGVWVSDEDLERLRQSKPPELHDFHVFLFYLHQGAPASRAAPDLRSNFATDSGDSHEI